MVRLEEYIPLELSGQLAQLEVLLAPASFWSGQHSPWPGCEVLPVQGQACAGQELGQAGPADDHQRPRGGKDQHTALVVKRSD